MILLIPTKPSLLAYLINQTIHGNKCTYILKRSFNARYTLLVRSAPSPWTSLPLSWVTPKNIYKYKIIIKCTHTKNDNSLLSREGFKGPEYFPLCEDTPISFIIIHGGIKHVVANRKSKLLGLRIDRFFVSAHNNKRL